MVYAMKRRAENDLEAWKGRAGRRPLVVRGARQVGKTFLVEEFGRRCFDSFLTVNLEQKRDEMKMYPERLRIGILTMAIFLAAGCCTRTYVSVGNDTSSAIYVMSSDEAALVEPSTSRVLRHTREDLTIFNKIFGIRSFDLVYCGEMSATQHVRNRLNRQTLYVVIAKDGNLHLALPNRPRQPAAKQVGRYPLSPSAQSWKLGLGTENEVSDKTHESEPDAEENCPDTSAHH